jgi:hypothetical protein
MPRWAFLYPYWSHIDGKPFLSRFIFWFTPWGGCHITWIRQADNAREYPHDHSATFMSLMVSGGYEEDVYTDPGDLSAVRHLAHRRWSRHVMKAGNAHSITRIKPFTVTLLILGPREQPSNYWTPEGKMSIGLKMDEWG